MNRVNEEKCKYCNLSIKWLKERFLKNVSFNKLCEYLNICANIDLIEIARLRIKYILMDPTKVCHFLAACQLHRLKQFQ
jgi:hypothetical protein